MSRRHLPIAPAIVLALVLPAPADAQPLGHGGTLKIRCSRCIRQVTVTQHTPAGSLTYWLRIPERGPLYSWQVGDWRRVRGHGHVTRSRLAIHNTGAPVRVRVRRRASRLLAPNRCSCLLRLAISCLTAVCLRADREVLSRWPRSRIPRGRK